MWTIEVEDYSPMMGSALKPDKILTLKIEVISHPEHLDSICNNLRQLYPDRNIYRINRWQTVQQTANYWPNWPN